MLVRQTDGKRWRTDAVDALQDDVETALRAPLWRLPWLFAPETLLQPVRGLAREGMDWAPPIDAYEEGDDIVFKVDLPGVSKGDAHVEVRDNHLIIYGERKSEGRDENYHRAERTTGHFYRRIALPSGVNATHVRASITDGVLEVRVPKPEEAKREGQTHTVTVS